MRRMAMGAWAGKLSNPLHAVGGRLLGGSSAFDEHVPFGSCIAGAGFALIRTNRVYVTPP